MPRSPLPTPAGGRSERAGCRVPFIVPSGSGPDFLREVEEVTRAEGAAPVTLIDGAWRWVEVRQAGDGPLAIRNAGETPMELEITRLQVELR